MKPANRLSLMAAAIVAPVVGEGTAAQAQELPASAEAKISYFYYEDWQSGGQDRILVRSPMLWARSDMGENWEIEGTFQIDDISGASPLYLDALTGASALGIEDYRNFGDVRVTRQFERYSLSLGGAYSGEDDWRSRSASLEASWWTEDKNTTISFGLSPTWDRITSTNNAELLERRRSLGWLLGVTQVLTPSAVAQVNLFYQNSDGYHSDQYKFFDKRPRSRDEYMLVARFNQYIEDLDAALHADYRGSMGSWDISSHMLEMKWYQPVFASLMVRPNLRWYSQTAAHFFDETFPPTSVDSFWSYDQRMGAFGGLTYGVKAEYQLTEALSIDALIQWTEQRGSWAALSSGSEAIPDFYARYSGVGISARF